MRYLTVDQESIVLGSNSTLVLTSLYNSDKYINFSEPFLFHHGQNKDVK